VDRYLALDLHKAYIYGGEWEPEAKKVRHFRVPNTREGWEELRKRLDRNSHIAVEATGNVFELYDFLRPDVADIVVANPLELKRLGSGRHTDRVDVDRLVHMLLLGTVPPVWVPPEPVRSVRRLLRYRERLVSNRRRYINQVKAVLRRGGIVLPAEADVREAVAQSTLRSLPWADRTLVHSALRHIRQLDREIDDLDAAIARTAAHTRAVRLVLTLTGLGPVAATALWAVIGDPHRFRHGKQVARYMGLDPRVTQSGEEDHRGHISKQGNRMLRSLLVEAAHSVARHDPGPLGQFYRRKVRQLGTAKAIVALARKIAVVAWALMRTGRAYCAVQPKTMKRKVRALCALSRRPVSWDEHELELPEYPVDWVRRRRIRPPTAVAG
jgi:transposase